MTLINENTTLKRNPELISSEVDGEKVMMDIKSGEYFGLDSVGSRIWDLMETPIKVSVMVELLVNEFDVSKEQCQQDTIDFIGELAKKKLVIIISE